jgi:hypothetical protein
MRYPRNLRDKDDYMFQPTLRAGAGVHLDENVLCAVDKALGHMVFQRFWVIDNVSSAVFGFRFSQCCLVSR